MDELKLARILGMLRDYQADAINGVARRYASGTPRVVLASPTGSGKTEIAAGMMARIIKAKLLPEGKLPYFICHQVTLVDQAVERFESHGFNVAVLQGENTTAVTADTDVVVASIQTINARLKPGDYGTNPIIPDNMGAALIDECHHIHTRHREIAEKHPEMLLVGLTATPFNPKLGAIYQGLVTGLSPRECVKRGWLVPWRCYGPDPVDLSEIRRARGDYVTSDLEKQMILLVGDTVSLYKRLGENRQCLVFAVDIAHAEALAAQFRKEKYPAAAVSCYTDRADWLEIKRQFAAGEIRVLVSVFKLAVGFDSPIASCAIMARPTLSELLYYQMAGRVARPHPASGKVDGLLLDQTGNIERFGLPQDLEYPESLDELELGAREKKKREKKEPETRPCLKCGYMVECLHVPCPNCGHSVPKPVNVIAIAGGRLVPLDSEEAQDYLDEQEAEKHRRLYRQVVTWLRRNTKANGDAYNPWYAKRLWEQVYKQPPPYHPPSNARDLTPDAETERWIRNAQRQKYAIDNATKKRQRRA